MIFKEVNGTVWFHVNVWHHIPRDTQKNTRAFQTQSRSWVQNGSNLSSVINPAGSHRLGAYETTLQLNSITNTNHHLLLRIQKLSYSIWNHQEKSYEVWDWFKKTECYHFDHKSKKTANLSLTPLTWMTAHCFSQREIHEIHTDQMHAPHVTCTYRYASVMWLPLVKWMS